MKTKEEITDVVERYLKSKNEDVLTDFKCMIAFLNACISEGWNKDDLYGIIVDEGTEYETTIDDAIASRYCLLLVTKKLSFKDNCPLTKEEYKQVLAYREYKRFGQVDEYDKAYREANIPTKVLMLYWVCRINDSKVDEQRKSLNLFG